MSDTVEFRSRFARLRLTRQPEVHGFTPTGARTVTQKPIEYQFEEAADGNGGVEGKLVITATRAKNETLEDGIDWLRDGEETGVPRDAIEALKAHQDFGSDFWLKGFSPAETRLLPRPVDFRKDVVRASAALDIAAIEALLQQELDTHGRGDLVTFAQDALETVRETAASLTETVESGVVAEAPKGKK